MIAPLLIAGLLAQAPAEVRSPVVVVISSKRVGADDYAKKLVARVHATLKKQGIEALTDEQAADVFRKAGGADPKNCDGAGPCLQKLAMLVGPNAVVVGVDVGKIQKQLAIHLEAVAADLDKPLAVADVMTQASKWAGATADIQAFADQLKPGLAIEAPPAPPLVVASNDRPEAPKTLTPAPKSNAEVAIHSTPVAGGSRVVPWALAGGAAAAGVTAGVFAFLGAGDQAAFEKAKFQVDGQTASTLTQPQLNALADAGNTKFTIALTSAIAGAALGAASTYFFLKE